MSNFEEKNKNVEEITTSGYQKVENTVVGGYQKIENTVVGGYTKIQDTVVGGYQKVEDFFVDHLFAREGETVKEAKERLLQNKENHQQKHETKNNKGVYHE